MIFPWQSDQWQQLFRSKQEGRLAHALLLTGMAGTGKAQFADSFSRALLCQHPNVKEAVFYCNTCHACRLLAGRTHPNVLWIEPEKEDQAIKIDQVREISEFIYHSGLDGEYRVVVINPANNMNTSAANALLKTLEEPPTGAILILVSDLSKRLPATILSRCQRVIFPQPQKELALSWLKTQITDRALDPALLLNLANGAPLAALGFMQNKVFAVRENLFQALYSFNKNAENPVKLAAKLPHDDLILLLDFTLSWLTDLLRLQLGDDHHRLTNKDYEKQLLELKNSTLIKNNTKMLEYLCQLRGQICSGINLNKQLALESIFIKWMKA